MMHVTPAHPTPVLEGYEKFAGTTPFSQVRRAEDTAQWRDSSFLGPKYRTASRTAYLTTTAKLVDDPAYVVRTRPGASFNDAIRMASSIASSQGPPSSGFDTLPRVAVLDAGDGSYFLAQFDHLESSVAGSWSRKVPELQDRQKARWSFNRTSDRLVSATPLDPSLVAVLYAKQHVDLRNGTHHFQTTPDVAPKS